MTTTVNLLFGSHVMVPETGIVMNNQMDDFSKPNVSNAFGFAPSPQNFIRPGKRPVSSISTTIVTIPSLPQLPLPPVGPSANTSSVMNTSSSSSSSSSLRMAPEQLYLAAGSAGGSRIISAVAQVLWRVLDLGTSAPAAVAAPRLHNQLQPNVLEAEAGYDAHTLAFLSAHCHNVTRSVNFATANAIRRLPNGTFEAAREPRQNYSGGYAF
jgi:gamma-glutamyltranspeptidase/glutathione hydrolase